MPTLFSISIHNLRLKEPTTIYAERWKIENNLVWCYIGDRTTGIINLDNISTFQITSALTHEERGHYLTITTNLAEDLLSRNLEQEEV